MTFVQFVAAAAAVAVTVRGIKKSKSKKFKNSRREKKTKVNILLYLFLFAALPIRQGLTACASGPLRSSIADFEICNKWHIQLEFEMNLLGSPQWNFAAARGKDTARSRQGPRELWQSMNLEILDG